jgi:hypothetical protein
VDYADKYRLVIATPNSPTKIWSAADDEYLQNIVNFVVDQIGKENIRAFWLVGHSQGGMTSNRLVRTDFFKARGDGWLSLSGGRLGGSPGRASNFGPPRAAASGAASAPAGPPPGFAATMAALRELPDFSFIFETGEREMDDKGIPETSAYAAKYNCGPRRKGEEIVDTKSGYVYDSTRQNPPNPSWGLLPAPGKAEVYTYPDLQGRPVRCRRRPSWQGTHRRTRAEGHRGTGQADGRRAAAISRSKARTVPSASTGLYTQMGPT